MSEQIQPAAEEVVGEQNAAQEVEAKPAKPEVKLQRPIYYPYAEGYIVDYSKIAEQLDLPPVTQAGFEKFRDNLPETVQVKTEELAAWASAIEGAHLNFSPKGLYQDFFSDPKAQLTNKPEHNGTQLRESPARRQPSVNQPISGGGAVTQLLAAVGRGIPRQGALWNTGMYIEVRPWTNMELGMFHTGLAQKVLSLGKRSLGLSFTKDEAVNLEAAVHFTLDHVIKTNINFALSKEYKEQGLSLKNILLKEISCLDIPTLLVSMISPSLPNGFVYRIPCITGMEKCNHVSSGVIKLAEALHTDYRKLSERQLAHLTKRDENSVPPEMLKIYQAEHLTPSREVVFEFSGAPVFNFKLRAPTLDMYFESVHRYINDMVRCVAAIAPKDISIEEKNAEYDKFSSLAKMRQLSHWIESVTDVGQNATASDPATIDEFCQQMSDNTDMLIFLHDSVTKFISDATVTAVGIPTYVCPKCHKGQDEPTELIPVDILYAFFELVEQRITRL